MILNEPQKLALQKLNAALQAATDVGLLDLMQPYCKEADSINDVCRAVEDIEG